VNRPLHIWLAFLGCLALLLGAMSWVTWHSLRVEKERETTAREAERQERVRLALWRLDFQASTLVIRENARPPEDFRAFHAPEGFVDKAFNDVAKGDVLVPSPLLGDIPDGVLLHFQVTTGGQLSSPQTPVGRERTLAVDRFVDNGVLDRASSRLGELRKLLQKQGAPENLKPLQPPGGAPLVVSNGQLLLQWNCTIAPTNNQTLTISTLDNAAPRNPNWNAGIVGNTMMQNTANSAENFQRNIAVEAQKNATLPQAPPKSKSAQGTLTLSQGGFQQAEKKDMWEKKEPYPSKAKTAKPEAKPSIKKKKEERAAVPDITAAVAQAPVLPVPAKSSDSLSAAPGQQGASILQTPLPPPVPSQAKPLQGFWLDNALLLTREAKLDNATVVQGVWLDWPKLREQWRNDVSDLFPNAKLEPAPNVTATNRPDDDPLRLASLPVRLVPGFLPLPPLPYWSPLRNSLLVAWACIVLAVAAVGLVLHGTVSLSERRAAFVSAVTHELRTPLTTFRLYSEMLADGMIKDEKQQHTYLSTLEAEAERLSHLVENVLAYARIERGSARNHKEHVSIEEVLERVLPRLKQRASQSNMEIAVESDEPDNKAKLHVDVAALEQILFNLVDNACKYAAPRAANRTIHVQALTRGPMAMIRVRDHGGGIAPGERRSIFRPFHKSADAAAHSAPGVGLGLALCVRLSKALGGKLSLEKVYGSGASFLLELPREA
jgi:signal transduction histidine kinase